MNIKILEKLSVVESYNIEVEHATFTCAFRVNVQKGRWHDTLIDMIKLEQKPIPNNVIKVMRATADHYFTYKRYETPIITKLIGFISFCKDSLLMKYK